jgi:hypothetical protein
VAFAGNQKMDSNGAEVLKNILVWQFHQEFYVKTAPNLRLDYMVSKWLKPNNLLPQYLTQLTKI